MALQEIVINSTKLLFDAAATNGHRTEHNKPCDCQNCRNYYKIVEDNPELIAFLSDFGVDFYHTEEVMSWDLDNEQDGMIHHEAYYGVPGRLEGEEVVIQRFGVKIAFEKGAIVPTDLEGEHFWIRIEGDFPYVLEEERDLGVSYKGKQKTFKDCLLEAGVMLLLLVLLIPVLLVYLIFKLLWMPVAYIKVKRSLYHKVFPHKFSMFEGLHVDSEPYAVIVENDLPVEYVKYSGYYQHPGYFIYKDTLLCFSEPMICDADKGIWYSWMDAEIDPGARKRNEKYAAECMTVEAAAEDLLQGLKEEHTEHTCNRVAFFFARKSVEGGYTQGSADAMRRLDNFVVYEKGELAKAIREFIGSRE